MSKMFYSFFTNCYHALHISESQGLLEVEVNRRERTESTCSDTIPDLCPIQGLSTLIVVLETPVPIGTQKLSNMGLHYVGS